MIFLVDANLAPGLAAKIRAAGYDCRHMSTSLPPTASDLRIALLADELGAAIITKDADFVDLTQRMVFGGALVLVKSGNMGNRRMAELLLPAMPRIVAAIESGQRIIEVR